MPLKFETVLQDYCMEKKKKHHVLLFKGTDDKYFFLTVSALESLSRGLGLRPSQVIVLCPWAKHFTLSGSLSNWALGIQRVDNAIHRMCHPPVDTLVHFLTTNYKMVIYP